MELIYGEVNNGLVFIERRQAEDLAAVEEALDDASTWGEFKTRISEERWRQAIARVTDEGTKPEPALGDRFTRDAVPGAGEMDWPEWPAQAMLKWVPADIQRRFGRIESSVVSGPMLALDPKDEEEIVAAFEQLGWTCEEDQSLAQSASGF